MNRKINYSQCWEDTDILLSALKINKFDIVLSITSGGDNTLAILLKNPAEIVALDLNQSQNYLTSIKLTAARNLNYSEYLKFLGVVKSDKRIELFKSIENSLEKNARNWFLKNKDNVQIGVINTGRFEKYQFFFNNNLLPLAHSKNTIKEFINIKTLNKQRIFFNNKWNTAIWKLYIKLITNKYLIKGFARQKEMYNSGVKISRNNYGKRLEKKLTTIPIYDNYYIHYFLYGSFVSSFPHYLRKSNQDKLKNISHQKLKFVSSDIYSYLKKAESNYFTKFNLSDIFEGVTPSENEKIWGEIIRTSKKDAIIVYWENLIHHKLPKSIENKLTDCKTLSDKLFNVDKTFFYNHFHVYRVKGL